MIHRYQPFKAFLYMTPLPNRIFINPFRNTMKIANGFRSSAGSNFHPGPARCSQVSVGRIIFGTGNSWVCHALFHMFFICVFVSIFHPRVRWVTIKNDDDIPITAQWKVAKFAKYGLLDVWQIVYCKDLSSYRGLLMFIVDH